MTTLIRPDNNQPAPFVVAKGDYICLRTDCITPAVRWFPLAALDALNPVHTCAEPPLTDEKRRALIAERYAAAVARKNTPVIIVTSDMVGQLYPTRDSRQGIDLSLSSGVKIFTITPPTLWHESMRDAA